MSELELIYSYTRKEAVADGFQVEIDLKTSKAAGINYPVYMTRTVWDRYVEVPAELTGAQDEPGRLWDILWMFAFYACKSSGAEMKFQFICQLTDKGDWPSNEVPEGDNPLQRLVTLKSMIGPIDIDDPSPAITILLPNED